MNRHFQHKQTPLLRRPSILTPAAIFGLFFIAIWLFAPPRAVAQIAVDTGSSSTLDSLTAAYQRHLLTLTSPELEERMFSRRHLQRQGYAEVLQELLAGDGVSALMSWLRTMLQLEYSIPRRTLYLYVRIPETRRDTSLTGRMMPSPGGYMAFPLAEDRSFPVDPWAVSKRGRRP